MQSGNIEKSRIVTISNPRSGRNKRGGFNKFNHALKNYPFIRHIVTSSELDLIPALEQCKQGACEVIIVNGGDGTLLQILTYLKQSENIGFKPNLLLLQAGTTSMAYGDVGCKAKLNIIFDEVIKYIDGNSKKIIATKREVLRMSLPEKSQTVCGMFFGAGAIYNGILYCRQNLHTKGMRGELGPSMAMIRYIFDWLTVNNMTTSTHAQVRYDQKESIEGDYTVITATSLHRLLMGVYPFWGEKNSDAYLALTLIKRNAPRAMRAFIKILLGKSPGVEPQENYYRSVCVSKVMLSINDGFTLDGELFGEAGRQTKVELDSAGEVIFLTI